MSESADDTTFLSIEHKGSGNDVFIAPVAFESLDELFTTSELALAPDDSLQGFRDGWVMHFLFPSQMSQSAEDKLAKTKESLREWAKLRFTASPLTFTAWRWALIKKRIAQMCCRNSSRGPASS
jgi:hypothetical protein